MTESDGPQWGSANDPTAWEESSVLVVFQIRKGKEGTTGGHGMSPEAFERHPAEMLQELFEEIVGSFERFGLTNGRSFDVIVREREQEWIRA